MLEPKRMQMENGEGEKTERGEAGEVPPAKMNS